MNLRFRPARPGDVDLAAPLIYSSGAEAFDYILDQGSKVAIAFLRHAFVDGRGFFGYRNHVVIEADARIAGIGAFYSGREYNALSLGMGRQLFQFYGIKGATAVTRRSLVTLKIMPAPGRQMEYVSSLGVAPHMQSKGIGTALLSRHKKMARARQRSVYALDVSVNNPRAQQLYERFGFRVTKENQLTGAWRRVPVPATRRMEINL